jgi:hypothetical protein
LGFSSFRIIDLFRKRAGARIPFSVREIELPDSGSIELFERAFKSPPPMEPRHFVAILQRKDGSDNAHRVGGYIHFSRFEDGVFLCGGLCIDWRLYRALSRDERAEIAGQGSLSRWLSLKSIASLGDRTAVFAYTGDRRSRRDALALGFETTRAPFLLVQWHGAIPDSSRAALISRVEAHGPF